MKLPRRLTRVELEAAEEKFLAKNQAYMEAWLKQREVARAAVKAEESS
jgi:hypothetical protein